MVMYGLGQQPQAFDLTNSGEQGAQDLHFHQLERNTAGMTLTASKRNFNDGEF